MLSHLMSMYSCKLEDSVVEKENKYNIDTVLYPV